MTLTPVAKCGITHRRAQQLAKEYRNTGAITTIETPGCQPYPEYQPELIERIL